MKSSLLRGSSESCALQRAFLAALVAAACGCACEAEGVPGFSFFLEETEIDWSRANPWNLNARVVFESRVDDEGLDRILEIYQGTELIDVPATVMLISTDEHVSRVHTEVHYDLQALPDGEYTLVHRRSSVPAGLIPVVPSGADAAVAVPVPAPGDGVPWEDFEGEEALVTPMLRGMPSGPDGGAPGDAGAP